MKECEKTKADNELEANSNKEDSGDEEIAAKITGDTIGDTAYSQRFVISILMKLSSGQEISEDFIEEQVEKLLSLSAEKDVSEFLISLDSLNIFDSVLRNSNNNRLIEIILGTVANMCCHENVILEIIKNIPIIEHILTYLNNEDSLIIVQVLRFLYSCIYNGEEHLEIWVSLIEKSKFSSFLSFFMENSTNEDVLMNCFETLNCICSVFSGTSCQEKFIHLFVIKEIVYSTFTAFFELQQKFTNSGIELEKKERCQMVYLAIHSILSSFNTQSMDVYADERDVLFKHINEIINQNIKNKSPCVSDIAEYTVAIISYFNCPLTQDTLEIFNSMIKVYKQAFEANKQKLNVPNFDEPENDEDQDYYLNIITVLMNYFVRVIKLWPYEKIESLFKKLDRELTKNLQSTIENMINKEEIDKFYNDVCKTIEKINGENSDNSDS